VLQLSLHAALAVPGYWTVLVVQVSVVGPQLVPLMI
jgi:hypothetical protein